MTRKQMKESTYALEKEAYQISKDICEFPKGIRVPFTEGEQSREVILWMDHWTNLSKHNTEARLCSMSTKTLNKTVVNVFLGKGGRIDTHAQDRLESIYVIDGSYRDPVTNRVYRTGDRQNIAPFQTHGLVSDYALLTITWEPAYTEPDSAE